MKKRKFTQAIVVFAFFCLATPLYAALPWLHTDANLIKDPCGNTVVLRGVDTIDIGATEEWYGGLTATIDRVTDKSNSEGNSPGWYTKVIRLAIYPQDEDAFSGGPKYYEDDPNGYYNDFLRPAIDYCKTKDIYAIIDWHYVGENTYDKVAETNAFWSFMAPKFAGDSHVLFELFNEPLNTSEGSETANWARLKNDMQIWIDIIRASAPNNLILVGGPSWSQQIGPAASNPFSTSNSNNTNLVMVVHIYPGHWLVYGQDYYKSQVTTCITRYPIFATEWGFWDTTETLLDGTIDNYGQPLMDFYEGLKISHSAWCAAYAWNPPMFDSNGYSSTPSKWKLRVGDGEMGGFVKDMLYAKRNSDQPGGENNDIINFIDFAVFAANWKRSDCNSSNLWCDNSDKTQDGNVLLDDLKEFVSDWLDGANTPPSVSITSPADGATFTSPADITISADACDSDGNIISVSFYESSTLLGTVTSSPYSYTWTSVTSGSYTLTAVATDDYGDTTTSSAITIDVNSSSTGCTCDAGCSTKTTITPDFTQTGSGTYCWEATSLGSYINSWDLDVLKVNGVDLTNTYVAASSLPAKIDGKYYVYYKGSYSWSHFEAKN